MAPRIYVWSAAYQMNAMLDDGADVTIIDFHCASAILGLQVEPSNTPTIQFAQGEAEVDGECWIELAYPGGRCSVKALVLRDAGEDLLLGRDFLLLSNIDCKLNQQGWCFSNEPSVIYPFAPILSSSDRTRCNLVAWKQTAAQDKAGSPEFQREMLKIVDEFDNRGLFSDKPGEVTLVEHEIVLKPGSRPFMAKPRMMSPAKSTAFVKEIDKWLEQGIIERADSPWGSPPVIVEKPGSTPENPKVRVCFDYRRLNEMTVLVPTEVDRADFIFSRLGKAKFITVVDATSGYFHYYVKKECRDYTAFNSPRGQFRFRRMPFGVAGGTFTYVKGNAMMIRGCEAFALSFIDDVIVFSDTEEDHLDHVHTVLGIMWNNGVHLSPEKVQLAKHSVKLLGHIVGNGEIKPDPQKVEAISNFPAPRDPKEVLRFLGMVGFFREYIPLFGRLARPLYNLVKKDQDWKWQEEEQTAFVALRQALLSHDVLMLPDWSKPFLIETDASYTGLGAVLLQEGAKGMRPIGFASRTLLPAEKNYCVGELECLAVIYAINKFRQYVEMAEVVVETDHKALQSIMSLEHPSGRIYRWMLKLLFLRILIRHRQGSKMLVADPLSRAPHGPDTDLKLSWMDEFVPVEDPAIAPRLQFEGCDDTPPAHSCARCSDKAPQEVTAAVIARHLGKEARELRALRVTMGTSDDQPISTDEWIIAQTHDSEISTLAAMIRAKSQQAIAKGFALSAEGLLTKKSQNGGTKVVVPPTLRSAVCRAHHDHCLAGHGGVQRTIERISRIYTWRNMHSDIKAYVRGCDTCQQCRHDNAAPKGHMAADIPSTPYSSLAVDFVGPLPHGAGSFRFAFLIMDLFTKNLDLYPLRRATAANAADCLVDFCTRYGFPTSLRSDQGSQFTGKMWQVLCDKLHISRKLICPYRQKGNPAERCVQTVKTTLRPFLTHHKDWHKYIPMALFAIRTARHRSTGQTPAVMTFGRQLRSPFDTAGQTNNAQAHSQDTAPSDWSQAAVYARELVTRLEEAVSIAGAELKVQYRTREESYNEGRRPHTFEKGDLVLRQAHHLSSAEKGETQCFFPKFEGPFVISAKTATNTFELVNLVGAECGVANADQLKAYHDQPLWAREPLHTPPETDGVNDAPPVEQNRMVTNPDHTLPPVTSHSQGSTTLGISNPPLPQSCARPTRARRLPQKLADFVLH
jgi:hypothetical protein